MAQKKQAFPGWQTMAKAAKKVGITRQRLHQVIAEEGIETMQVFRYRLVPDPFPYARKR